MIDLREKIIVYTAIAVVLALLLWRARERRQARELEFRQAWQTIGDTLWTGLNRG